MYQLTRKQRLTLAIGVSFSFFITELIVGFLTRSFALVADAFHYFSDFIGLIVALVALMMSEKSKPAPQEYTFGWQRATLLGSFFNGVFLFALGVSILLQAVERCIHLDHMKSPGLVLIIGCVGFVSNILAMSFLHEHDHNHGHDYEHGFKTNKKPRNAFRSTQNASNRDKYATVNIPMAHHTSETASHCEHKHTLAALKPPGRDLGMIGVFLHVMGDAINNIGVIIAAAIIWKSKGESRYYADPAVGVFISIMILLSSFPLVRTSGVILLQIAPGGIELKDVKHDIEMIPGIKSVHELHIWRLDQRKSIASAHIVVDDSTVKSFLEKAKIIMECLHAYGIHSATLQPEISPVDPTKIIATVVGNGSNLDSYRPGEREQCQLVCGRLCDAMRCCTHTHGE